jgi:hypothetical protein
MVCVLACVSVLKGHAQFVTLEGRRFMLNGHEFYPVVLNYGTEFVADDWGNDQPEEIYYSPMHELDLTPQNHFECDDPPSCNQQLREHFDKIVEMGFNTVRLGSIAPKAFRTGSSEPMFKLKVKHIAQYGEAYYVALSTAEPEFNDPMSDRYVELVSEILDAADYAGLKVILLTDIELAPLPPYDIAVEYDWEMAMLYSKLLRKLAAQLRDHPALMAYDLLNEPAWQFKSNNLTHLSKSVACDMTTLWYDAVTDEDPNHLVTLGGAGKHDIGSWDPAAMKIDFYSPHIYLEDDWGFVGEYDMPTIIDMYMAELHWFGASTEMPWMIGETSFSANDGNTDFNNDANFVCLDGALEHHVMPYMHGTEDEQAVFVEEAMDATRASRGSGFSWWYMQDGRTHPYQTAEPGEIRSNYFGALGYGDGTNRWREKPMVDVVQAYQPEPLPGELPEPPPSYWNWHSLPNNVYRTYHLVDQNQEPIANGIALVEWKFPFGPGQNQYYPMWARAVSDENGTVVLHEPDAIAGLGGPNAGMCIVDAPGASREPNNSPWPNEHVFELERDLLTYSSTLAGLSLINQPGSRHAAWAELTILDGDVSASGAESQPVIFEARHWVHVTGEFHIDDLSEALIGTNKTFPDCSSPHLGMVPEQADVMPLFKNSLNKRASDVQLSFRQSGTVFKAYPNPCFDRVIIDSSEPGILSALDSRGLVVHQATMPAGQSSLDVRDWAPGVFLLTLKHTSGMHNIKLTKLH